MTLHCWMHWFWITRLAAVLALLMVCPAIAAPTFEPYALPLQDEQTESEDGSVSPDMWTLYHLQSMSSMNELNTELWPSDVSVSTYLPLETDATSQVFTTIPDQVPVLVPKLDSESVNLSEEVKVSISSVPESSTTEVNSLVIDLNNTNSAKNVTSLSVENSSDEDKISLDAVANTFISNSQGLDRPIVNVPRLITRDLKNSSESSSDIASHSESHDFALPSPLPQFPSPTSRTGKSATLFSEPFNLHPLFITTGLPPEIVSESSFSSSDFQQGPKIIDSINAGLVRDVPVNDRGEKDDGESVSRTIWIKPFNRDAKNPILKSEEQLSDIRNNPLDDAEMGDSPFNPPESSTVIIPKIRNLGEPPVPSEDLVSPTRRPADNESLTTGKIIVKVTPPLLSTLKSVNVTSQTMRTPEYSTRTGLMPPAVINSEGNLSIAGDRNVTSSITHETGDKNSSAVHSRIPEGKNSSNITHASDDESEMTVVPTVVPVSNRVQAPAPSGPHHGLDAASITGISLGILVFAALIGAISFVLYRRRFLNKPQTLNDKCSNPDSSGYIDDSTLRENSEEMYSLDNDSFLNSLEAMTIQNYWTDNRYNSTRKFGALTEMVH